MTRFPETTLIGLLSTAAMNLPLFPPYSPEVGHLQALPDAMLEKSSREP
jgi:hypothetical protein